MRASSRGTRGSTIRPPGANRDAAMIVSIVAIGMVAAVIGAIRSTWSP